MFWFFSPEACVILVPRPGIQPTPPALEGEVLTTGVPGKSCSLVILLHYTIIYAPELIYVR